MHNSLAVVTVVYNNYSDLKEFFASFDTQSTQSFHIFVVDVSTKPQQYSYPSYVTTLTSDNKGYAHGLNVGMHAALNQGYQKYAFINNDTTVDKNFVKASLNSCLLYTSL